MERSMSVFVCVVLASISLPVVAQGAFTRGFEMGSRAYESAAASKSADQALRQQRELLRLRYGVPELDKLEHLERDAEQHALTVDALLAEIRKRNATGSNAQ